MRYERLALVSGLGLVAACKSTTAPELATSEPSPQAPEERPIAMENAPMKYTKPTDAELQQRLTPLQYRVTQHDATEPPFRNEFWDNHEKGLYVDVVTGQPLFSSSDKFDSGTGWPSFTRPVEEGVVVEKRDVTLGMVRIEVRSVAGDSHLGHVFDDGPAPSHLRYCINSASLRFIPVESLATEGYASYVERVSGGEIAAHTDNACVPAAQGQPGAGCAATLDTTTLPALSGAASAELRAAPGVLEVRDTAAGVEVLFDPALTSAKALRELAR